MKNENLPKGKEAKITKKVKHQFYLSPKILQRKNQQSLPTKISEMKVIFAFVPFVFVAVKNYSISSVSNLFHTTSNKNSLRPNRNYPIYQVSTPNPYFNKVIPRPTHKKASKQETNAFSFRRQGETRNKILMQSDIY